MWGDACLCFCSLKGNLNGDHTQMKSSILMYVRKWSLGGFLFWLWIGQAFILHCTLSRACSILRGEPTKMLLNPNAADVEPDRIEGKSLRNIWSCSTYLTQDIAKYDPAGFETACTIGSRGHAQNIARARLAFNPQLLAAIQQPSILSENPHLREVSYPQSCPST